MNKKITTILFDFDGVIVDTEYQYDQFSEILRERYNLPEDFVNQAKGTTMQFLFDKYFSEYPQKELDEILREFTEFELNLSYTYIDGAQDFIKYLQNNNYKIGLVTSSSKTKMELAYKKLKLKDTFEIRVTGDDISEGKPNPMCYMKAANMLNSQPEECLVFEDAIHGVNAGKNAGMTVIALTTSFSATEIATANPDVIIKDFTDMNTIKQVLN